MARTPVPINTGVGRFVGGSLYQGSTKDDKGQTKVYKTGPNAGQPRTDYSVGIALRKTQGHWANEPGWGQTLWAEAHACWPNGQTQQNTFAWKVVDGDSAVPNKKMKKPCEQEGYPGHWVLWFTGTTPPAVATAIGQGIAPTWQPQPNFCNPGDFIEITGTIASNESDQSPGMYLNYGAVCMRAYGERIQTQGVDLATAGFGAAPLPAGASMVPLGNVSAPPVPGNAPAATPSIPVAPAIPVPAAAVPLPTPGAPPAPVAVVPNPAILGAPSPVVAPPVPVALPVPTAPPAPAAGLRQIGPHTYEALKAAGWSDQQMIDAGHFAR
jgi:hypothetical protein